MQDIEDALAILRPLADGSNGGDGFVSVEVAPELARDTAGTIDGRPRSSAADRRAEPVREDPRHRRGLARHPAVISEGSNINVTLLFGLERYGEVIEAYMRGLEELDASGGDVSKIASVASFFVSRVDTEVDRRLEDDRHRRGARAAGQGRGRQRAARLRAVHASGAAPTMGGTRGEGRPGAAPAVGVDVDEEPRVPRHALRRQADRSRHRQHDARQHARGVRGPRPARPHGRRRPAGRPRGHRPAHGGGRRHARRHEDPRGRRASRRSPSRSTS